MISNHETNKHFFCIDRRFRYSSIELYLICIHFRISLYDCIVVLNLNVDQRRGRLVIENLLDYYYIIILKKS